MKKSLVICGVAALALASCTQSEVLDVTESRAISFNAFVNNNTRATINEVTKDNIAKFWVFGGYEQATNTWVDFYTNVQVDRGGSSPNYTWTPEELAYWQENKNHNFGAYANGTANLSTPTSESLAGVSYSAKENKLTFTNYSAVTGTNDLVAATAKEKKWDGSDPTTPNKVEFTFKHMLSKIYFTFKTKASKDYIMKVTNLKIDGVAQPASGAIVAATGTLTDETIAWETAGTVTKGEYTFGEIADYAEGTQNSGYFSASSEARFVIPQDNTYLTASFTVTVYDKGNNQLMTNDFTDVPVKYTAAASNGKGETAKWTPGYVYNYIAEINPDQVNEDAKPIEFSVTEVKDWTPADDNTIVEPQP